MLRTLAIVALVACGSSSGSPAVDGAMDGPLIDGPIGEWRWYEVPGAICANGSPTGLGVNQGAGDQVAQAQRCRPEHHERSRSPEPMRHTHRADARSVPEK